MAITLEQLKAKLAANGIVSKSTAGRDQILEALKKAGQRGLSIEEMAAAGGNTSKTDVSRTVQSAISHLRTKQGAIIENIGEKHYQFQGMINKDGEVEPAEWVNELE